MRHRRWAQDRPARRPRSFVQTRKADAYYSAQLRKIARHIGELIEHSVPTNALEADALAERLRRYSEMLEPWAQSVAERMIADVSRRDRQVWRDRSREMGRLLRQEIESAPTGDIMRGLLNEQVGLIKSLPIEAARRVHKLTLEGITSGVRAETIAKEIMRTGEVTKARANTIARTEVSRTASALTQARAEHIGSTGYIWRTAGDSDVRESHRKMNGEFVRWDSPPTLDGLTGHAGALPNCRCTVLPVVPDLE